TRLAANVLRRIVQAPFAWYLRQNTSVLRDVVVSHTVVWAREVIRPALMLANNFLILLSSVALLLPFTPGIALLLVVASGAVSGALITLSRPRLLLTGGRKQRSGLLVGMAATEAITAGRDVRMSQAGEVLVAEFHRGWSIYAHSDGDQRQWQNIPRLGIETIGIMAVITIGLGRSLIG